MMNSAAGPLMNFLPVVLIFIVFYFLLIRPQQKKQKDHATMLSKLEKNDEIVTAGGVHATVISVGEKTAIIRIADNVRVEIEKSAVSQVVKAKNAS